MLNRPSAERPPHDPSAAPFRLADPGAALVGPLDLGVTRGDGVFETVSVGFGRAQALEAHLQRFARSAAMLDLPTPDLAAWRGAIVAAIAAIDPVDEAYVKTVFTRGIEGDDVPTGWAYATVAPDNTVARRLGIRVVTLDRGYAHDVAATSPWLLQGAKTLSYAMNRAAVREAQRRDADDVIFVSSDGIVLEGPTANVVLRHGDELVTPDTTLGILAGTTQSDLFRFARSSGLGTRYELLRRDALDAADAVWLVSSVRHAAPVRAIDGVDRPIDAALTAAMNDFLLHRVD